MENVSIAKADDRLIPVELTGGSPLELIGSSANQASGLEGVFWLDFDPSKGSNSDNIVGRTNELGDVDGIETADITGNGKADIIASNSTGDPGVYWYEQGDGPTDWTEHVVDTNSEFQKIEGNDAAHFDGDGAVEVVTLDQVNGTVYISKLDDNTDPAGTWTTTPIDQNAGLAQCGLDMDIMGTGTPDLVYTYPQNGVGWLEFLGGDILKRSNWRKHLLLEEPGPWWIAQEPRDLSENGVTNDIVVSKRTARTSNDGEILWLEGPKA